MNAAEIEIASLWAEAAEVTPPHGLEEIVERFGDVREYIGHDGKIDPRWPAEILGVARLPFPLRLAWDPKIEIRKFSCHRKLAELVEEVFARLEAEKLAEHVRTFGGCYAYRAKRGSKRISTHAWAIAIDLNPESNIMGTHGDMNGDVVEVFRSFGFTWGGEWKGAGCDPMHFQWCSGY